MVLPKDVSSSRWFTQSEKKVARMRLEKEAETETNRFSLAAVLQPLRDWKTWLYGFMALCYGVACASISNFLPVRKLHYHNLHMHGHVLTAGVIDDDQTPNKQYNQSKSIYHCPKSQRCDLYYTCLLALRPNSTAGSLCHRFCRRLDGRVYRPWHS